MSTAERVREALATWGPVLTDLIDHAKDAPARRRADRENRQRGNR